MDIVTGDGWDIVDEVQQEAPSWSGASASVAIPADSGWQAYDPKTHASEVAQKYEFDPDVFHGLIRTESAWNPKALGPPTKYGQAKGLTQMIPATAKAMGVIDPYDPHQSIEGGGKYFKQQLDRFGGSYEKALVAYNWGPENAKNWDGDRSKLPKETQDYLFKVLGPEPGIGEYTPGKKSKYFTQQAPQNLGNYMQRFVGQVTGPDINLPQPGVSELPADKFSDQGFIPGVIGSINAAANTPTPWPGWDSRNHLKSAGAVSDMASTGLAKAMWKLNPLVWGYGGTKLLTDEVTRALKESTLSPEQQIARHDIDNPQYIPTVDPVIENLRGFADFTGRPLGLSGLDVAKESWKNEPVDSLIATLGLLLGGVAARKRVRKTGEYTQKEQLDFAKSEAQLNAEETAHLYDREIFAKEQRIPIEDVGWIEATGAEAIKPTEEVPHQAIPAAPEIKGGIVEDISSKYFKTREDAQGAIDSIQREYNNVELGIKEIKTKKGKTLYVVENIEVPFDVEKETAEGVPRAPKKSTQYEPIPGYDAPYASTEVAGEATSRLPGEVPTVQRSPEQASSMAVIAAAKNERRNQAAKIFEGAIYESGGRAEAAADAARRKFDLEYIAVREGDFWHLERRTPWNREVEGEKPFNIAVADNKLSQEKATDTVVESTNVKEIIDTVIKSTGLPASEVEQAVREIVVNGPDRVIKTPADFTGSKKTVIEGRTIIEAMQNGAVIERNADKTGWVVDGKEVGEHTLKALLKQRSGNPGAIEWIPATNRYELTEPWKTEKAVRTEDQWTPAKERPLETFSSHLEALNRARELGAETGTSYRPEKRDGQWGLYHGEVELENNTETRLSILRDILNNEVGSAPILNDVMKIIDKQSRLWASKMREVFARDLPERFTAAEFDKLTSSYLKKGKFKPEEWADTIRMTNLNAWLGEKADKRVSELIKEREEVLKRYIGHLKPTDAFLAPDEMKAEMQAINEEIARLEKRKGLKITKQEILDWIDLNGIKVEEVRRGGVGLSIEERRELGSLEHLNEMGLLEGGQLDRWKELTEKQGFATATKYEGRLQLPGGGEYVELILTSPHAEKLPHDPTHFIEGKGEQQIGWIRGKVFTDAQGRKIFHIEEVQSKRHSKGAAEGYINETKLRAELEELKSQKTSLEHTNSKELSEWRSGLVSRNTELYPMISDYRKTFPESPVITKYYELFDRIADISDQLEVSYSKIPDAPFRKTWPTLLLKRALKYAAENGYDGVSWTTGEQQIARNNTPLERIKYVRENADGSVTVSLGGRSENFSPSKELPPGSPEIAEIKQLLGDRVDKITEGIDLSQQPLEIGGKFHKKLYGSMEVSKNPHAEEIGILKTEAGALYSEADNISIRIRELDVTNKPVYFNVASDGYIFGITADSHASEMYKKEMKKDVGEELHTVVKHVTAEELRKLFDYGDMSEVKVEEVSKLQEEILKRPDIGLGEPTGERKQTLENLRKQRSAETLKADKISRRIEELSEYSPEIQWTGGILSRAMRDATSGMKVREEMIRAIGDTLPGDTMADIAYRDGLLTEEEYTMYKREGIMQDPSTPLPPSTKHFSIQPGVIFTPEMKGTLAEKPMYMYTFPGPLGDTAKQIIKAGRDLIEARKDPLKYFWSLRTGMTDALAKKNWYAGPTDPRSIIYKDGYDRDVRRFTNETLAIQEAQNWTSDIIRLLPAQDRIRFHDIRERTGDPNYTLSPAGQKLYAQVVGIMDYYKGAFQKYGRLREFMEEYFPHIVYEDPTGKRLDVVRFLKGREDPLSTLSALEKEGYKVERDVAVWFPTYLMQAEKTLARLEFLRDTKLALAEDGLPVIRPSKLVTAEQKASALFKRFDYSGRMRGWDSEVSYDNPLTNTEMKKLFEGDMWVHRDIFATLDGMFYDPMDASMNFVQHARSMVKRIRMYNPLFHGWNVATQDLGALGLDSLKLLPWFKPDILKTEAGVREVMQRFIGDGGNLEGLYDIRRRLGGDQYKGVLGLEPFKPRDLIDDPMKALTHPIKSLGDLSNYILFNKMLKTSQLIVYLTKYNRYMNPSWLAKNLGRVESLSPKEAGHLAAVDANNILGTLQPYTFTRKQRAILNDVLFARNWNVGTAKQVTGALPWAKEVGEAIVPKFLRTEGINPKQWKALSWENRTYITRIVVGAVVSANMMQGILQKANGVPLDEVTTTFQNAENHKLDIDTGAKDPSGNPIFLRNMLFRQVEDAYRGWNKGFMKMFMGKVEPIGKAVAEWAMNVDYRGRPIYGEEAGLGGTDSRLTNLKENSLAVIKHLARIMPYDDIVGRDNRIQSWKERMAPAIGTTVRYGSQVSAQLENEANAFHTWLGRSQRLSREALEDLKLLKQEGKTDEMTEKLLGYVVNRTISGKQFTHMLKDMNAPFYQKVMKHPAFKNYLMSLPEGRAEKVMGNIRTEFERMNRKQTGISAEVKDYQ